MKRPVFNYDPNQLPREKAPYYISASEEDIQSMLTELGLNKLEELFGHIPEELKFQKTPAMDQALAYEDLADHLFQLSQKNKLYPSFLGNGLPRHKRTSVPGHLGNIRGLTTAYTPYQPERSQGTLQTLWIYQNLISKLTGFEAINASLYERSTCLHEALNCALRLVKGSTTVLVCQSLYPQDLAVLETLTKETPLNLVQVPTNPTTGTTDIAALKKLLTQTSDLAALAFMQVNSNGLLEDVHTLTDLCYEHSIKAIGVIDPLMLADQGLTPPVHWGSSKQGAHMIVGEGQHIAIGPSYGGPGLGIFGIRFNAEDKLSIRQSAGRFVGKTKDLAGRDCKCMVLSTREQHIRREKATSNICSNQSYVATMAGGELLAQGAKGLEKNIQVTRLRAIDYAKKLTQLSGVELLYPGSSFFSEVALKFENFSAQELINRAQKEGLHIGVDIQDRTGNDNTLLVSFNDQQSESDLTALIEFFSKTFPGPLSSSTSIVPIDQKYLRTEALIFPEYSIPEIKSYYDQLGEQNVSPDQSLYPLGSCTMKYNPYINDWAANLEGFMELHPDTPVADAQGALEILYQTQNYFKAITGLAGVTTQPVAGAQGELVGIKMFQAYHQDRNEKRDIILIPRSAHGTNPATAAMAGFQTKVVDGVQYGIVLIEAGPDGMMDFNQLTKCVEKYNTRISGVMVTNPNTTGVFEQNFKKMSDLIANVGGLVYMDGANMNAIAGWIDLNALGVDAVHNNLHKTWSIPHGGGGPGDAIVAVSEKLLDYLPGYQVIKNNGLFELQKPSKSIGSFHRSFGNFGHKVRAYTYLRALGMDGIKKMSAVAVLSSRYILSKLSGIYPTLPDAKQSGVRLHEFILTLSEDTFSKIQKTGLAKAQVIARVGKLFLDFGLHAPTVAFPEVYGLMVEPTESFSKSELDRFVEIVKEVHFILNEHPEVLLTVPHFTPIDRVDEVAANKNLVLNESFERLDSITKNRVSPDELTKLPVKDITALILKGT